MIVTHKDFNKELETVKNNVDVPIYALDDSDVTLMSKALISRHLLGPMPEK